MRDIIKSVLDRHKDSQLNLGSESARESLSVEIEAVLLSKDIHIKNDEWLVGQYNRNRPIEDKINKVEEIKGYGKK